MRIAVDEVNSGRQHLPLRHAGVGRSSEAFCVELTIQFECDTYVQVRALGYSSCSYQKRRCVGVKANSC